MTPFNRSDTLHLQLAGSDVGFVRTVGTIAGVAVLAVAARNGPGIGRLIASAGSRLAWQAPGSSTPGASQACASDGVYLLEDGEDVSKFARVQVYSSYLAASGEAEVLVQDAYAGLADITAAQAAAGLTDVTTFALKNVSDTAGGAPVLATLVKMWLDQTAGYNPGLSISLNDVTFFTPTSAADPNALAWASIAAGASVPVYVKRIIAPAAAANPIVRNALQFQWSSA